MNCHVDVFLLGATAVRAPARLPRYMPPTDYGFWCLLPPILAIGLAIATRQVVPSLLAGVWVGWVILAGGNLLLGSIQTVDALIAVFAEGWQTKVVIFTLLMGSLLILMQRSGGVDGFVAWVSRWRWAQTRRGAQFMAWLIGMGVFIESTITCLVVGTVCRPLFDRLKISREKLAYICDATSAPVCMMIPINGWGAMVLGLLSAEAAAGHLGNAQPLPLFLAAVVLNFYSIVIILWTLIVCLTDWDFGPMRVAEKRAREEGKVLRDGAVPVVDEAVISMPVKPGVTPRLRNLMIPLGVMIIMVPLGIYFTGLAGVRAAGIPDPGFMDYLDKASGSTAVLWAIITSLVVTTVLMTAQKIFKLTELIDLTFKGAGGLLSLAAMMVLAFAIGAVCTKLGTGPWVASIAKGFLTPAMIAPVVFAVAGFIAFATGTSWGTFAIMMPLAVPLAHHFNVEGAHVSMPLVISAVLGGGVFGDHCSPISDTTVVSSMSACSDHVDHVRTQLPYALMGAAISFVLYIIAGMVL